MQWIRTAWSQTSILQKSLIGVAVLVIIGAAGSLGKGGDAGPSPLAATASTASPTPSPSPTAAPSASPTPTLATTPTPAPTSPAPTPVPPAANCAASYPDFCIPPPPPDLNCPDIAQKNFRVLWDVPDPDPHHFDADKDGIGCES